MYSASKKLNVLYRTGVTPPHLLQALFVCVLVAALQYQLIHHDAKTILAVAVSLLVPGAFLLCRAVVARTRESETRLRSILATTRDGIVVVDSLGRVIDLNPAAEQLFGHGRAELAGQTVGRFIPTAGYLLKGLKHKACSAADIVQRSHELTGRHKNGSHFPMEVSMGTMQTAGEERYVLVLRDITERKSAEEKLIELASTDSLTGAMNRRAFLSDAEKLFSLARRFNRPLSILALDADHFKSINDTFGHDAGDQALKCIVETLRSNLRHVDLVSRFGGEEFLVLLPETGADRAWLIAEKLRGMLASVPVVTREKQTIRVTCSIGLSSLCKDTLSLPELLSEADSALYKAKEYGRNQTVNYSGIPRTNDLFPEAARHH